MVPCAMPVLPSGLPTDRVNRESVSHPHLQASRAGPVAASFREHAGQVLGAVEVEGQLWYLDLFEWDSGPAGCPPMLRERGSPEPGGDDIRRPAQQQVRPP